MPSGDDERTRIETSNLDRDNNFPGVMVNQYGVMVNLFKVSWSI